MTRGSVSRAHSDPASARPFTKARGLGLPPGALPALGPVCGGQQWGRHSPVGAAGSVPVAGGEEGLVYTLHKGLGHGALGSPDDTHPASAGGGGRDGAKKSAGGSQGWDPPPWSPGEPGTCAGDSPMARSAGAAGKRQLPGHWGLPPGRAEGPEPRLTRAGRRAPRCPLPAPGTRAEAAPGNPTWPEFPGGTAFSSGWPGAQSAAL